MADAFLVAHMQANSPEKPDSDEALRELIMKTLVDMVSKLMYYDRKEDEELPLGAIEDAVERGVITHTEMMAKFYEEIRDAG